MRKPADGSPGFRSYEPDATWRCGRSAHPAAPSYSSPDDVATTIISYEEQTRGWLARLARATTLERQMSDYSELKQLLQNYCDIAVVDFDARAVAEFAHLRQTRIRVGTMDLKIAAIALANAATVLTRNLSDFGKVPGLKAEDWSV